MNNQLIVVVNCKTLKIKLEKKHFHAKVVLGDLSDQKSTKSIIEKCRSIFPIIELLVHIELITDKISEVESRLKIQSNFLELTRCLLSTLNNTHRTALILLKLKEFAEIDSERILQNQRVSDKDFAATVVSTLSDKNIQIIPETLQNNEKIDHTEKIVSDFLDDLSNNRIKMASIEPQSQMKGNMIKLKNILFSKKG